MRVYSVPGKKEQGEFALELATRAIEWYNEWFGIDYPLPKCDLIAIPDFAMGTYFCLFTGYSATSIEDYIYSFIHFITLSNHFANSFNLSGEFMK